MAKALIVGGGLAGMAAAMELVRHGVDAVILEASDRLGGKAGADLRGGEYWEHGYHIFPAWYVNTRKLLAELAIPLDDVNAYHFLREGEFPRFITVEFSNPLSGRELLSLPDRLLVFYFLIDMFGEHLSRRWHLDRISAMGLLRSKWYATQALASFNQENLLKAVAVPAYELSAYTSRLVGLNWASNPRPFLSLLRGNLQEAWIEPWAARLRAMGVTIEMGRRVEKILMSGGRVAGVEARDMTGALTTHTADVYVLATNLEVTRRFISDDVFAGDPRLGRIHQLESAPMTAYHLYLNRRLPRIPREHVFLSGGEYALSFVDVSQHWSGLANTALSFIASDFQPLRNLSEAAQKQALLGEVRRYLPIGPGDVAKDYLQPNVTTPLFLNTVASWPDRPEPKTRIPNLRIAGDYVRNHIDLATMEGAISSAQAAAASILDDLGLPHGELPARPFQYPRALFRALEVLLFPMVPPLWAWAKAREWLWREA